MGEGDLTRTTLVVVRHGETDWNIDGRIQGQLDEEVSLNEKGLAQAEAVAERLRDCPAEMLFSSDLRRARETAAAISRTTGLDPRCSQLLRERSLGSFERLTTPEIEERFPGALAAYDRDRWNYRPEGGESRGDLWGRSRRAMEWCFDEARGRTAIVVTHGGIIHSMIALALGHEGGIEPAVRADNCSVSVFVRAGDFTSLWLANDSAHASSSRKGDVYWTLK